MWGRKHGHDAYVCYLDEKMVEVREISFRIDARAISADLVRGICTLARELKCVLMTSEYEILTPDESMVLTSLNHSTAAKFVVDPVSTLRGLDHKKIRERVDYLMKRLEDDSPE